MANTDLFSSIISEIKAYTGDDPLLPWLRGVRNMRERLSPQLLSEKMPRFLQKCAQTFESDRRYRNDLRFIRIWIQLMDFVDDPKAILRNMEKKRIGTRRSLFYQAYALYYEKLKKFDEAEQIYLVGVQNLAEPLDDLRKSYEKFLDRKKHHKSKMTQRQEKRSSRRPLSDRSSAEQSSGDSSKLETKTAFSSHFKPHELSSEPSKKEMPLQIHIDCDPSKNDRASLQREDSVVSKFVDAAIVGGSEAEDACHHGLVDPTINMKEAMNAINNMFREPLETAAAAARRQCSNISQNSNSGFEVLNEQENGQQTFKIFADDEEADSSEFQSSTEKSPTSCSQDNGFPFLRPDDEQSEASNDANMEKAPKTKFREDTAVHRFVGSAILDDDAEVENMCHHGLVDPTINLKQAMDDINGMFGKPIDFVRMTRKKKLAATASLNKDCGEFSILPDDDLVYIEGQNQAQLNNCSDFTILPDDDLPASSSGNGKESHDLHEETVFTKQAIDDINKMFAMPLDF